MCGEELKCRQKKDVIEYLKMHYTNEDTKSLSETLELSISAVYTIARRNGISKSKEYLKKPHELVMKEKEEKYLEAIPNIALTQLEQNIILGSILGDGNLSFSQRCRNANYREHFSSSRKNTEHGKWVVLIH